jgi:hypothetical protein
MEIEISASFVLTRFKNEPEEITRMLGIYPTRTWKTGDLVGKTILKRKSNGWVLESSLEQTADLDSHIKNVLERLSPCWEKLRELGLQYYTEISCVIYNYEAQVPVMHFDKEIIKSAAELNAEIDIDYYSLYESE